MPERDFTRPATARSVVGTNSANVVRLSRCIGSYQSIAALNYGPRPKPGVWVANPNTIIKSHSACTPLPSVTRRISNVDYMLEGDVAGIHMAMTGYVPPFSWLNAPTWSTTRANEAAAQAYSKIMATDLDVGVMVGELRETLEGLRNPLSGLRSFLKKRSRGGGDFVSMLSSSWLEWRYGIRPLIQAIQDIYEHVNSECSPVDEKKLLRKRARAPEVDSRTSVTENIQIGPWQVQNNISADTATRYSASVGYTLTSPLTMDERFGLDAYSIPAIAWELTTLSFVVDWWLNIGSWLESLRVLNPKVQLAGITVSAKTTIDVLVTTTGRAWVNGTPVLLSGNSTATLKYQRLQRSVPSLAFTGVTPSLNSKAFDLKRTIDGLTLLWQRIAKGR